jgi:hypothetical protein
MILSCIHIHTSNPQSSPVSPLFLLDLFFFALYSCPVLSCLVLSCPVLSCPVLSCPVLSCYAVCSEVTLSLNSIHLTSPLRTTPYLTLPHSYTSFSIPISSTSLQHVAQHTWAVSLTSQPQLFSGIISANSGGGNSGNRGGHCQLWE